MAARRLYTGHKYSDECPASLAAYRAIIAELDRAIASLTARRNLLIRKLDESAGRTFADGAIHNDRLSHVA